MAAAEEPEREGDSSEAEEEMVLTPAQLIRSLEQVGRAGRPGPSRVGSGVGQEGRLGLRLPSADLPDCRADLLPSRAA